MTLPVPGSPKQTACEEWGLGKGYLSLHCICKQFGVPLAIQVQVGMRTILRGLGGFPVSTLHAVLVVLRVVWVARSAEGGDIYTHSISNRSGGNGSEVRD